MGDLTLDIILCFHLNADQLKMMEYNADTPTSLFEAAIVQWYWLQDIDPKLDQFNSLHEKLIAKFKDIAPYLKEPGVSTFFMS